MMTREEAIKHLRNDWFMSLGGQLCVDEDKKDAFLEAVGMGIKALRPFSREQVEKVWRGCDFCKIELDDYPYIVAHSDYSSSDTCYEPSFCPICGKPLTDEAVQMVMERMEKLYEAVE